MRRALTVPGLTAFTGGEGGLAATNFWFTNFQIYDDVSLQKGKHILKFGFDFIRYRYNTRLPRIRMAHTPLLRCLTFSPTGS